MAGQTIFYPTGGEAFVEELSSPVSAAPLGLSGA
jgi:hypothetical protein